MPQVIIHHEEYSSFRSFFGSGKESLSSFLILFSILRARAALCRLEGFVKIRLTRPCTNTGYIRKLYNSMIISPFPVAVN